MKPSNEKTNKFHSKKYTLSFFANITGAVVVVMTFILFIINPDDIDLWIGFALPVCLILFGGADVAYPIMQGRIEKADVEANAYYSHKEDS